MSDLAATSPLGLQSGRHGRADGIGATLRLIRQRNVVSVIARKGKTEMLVSSAKQAFGVTLPDRPRLECGLTASFLWSGHEHWLAVADQPDLLSQLRANLGAFASLSDQSDSRVILELSGPAARQALAKLVPIDLHARAFRPSDTALTLFGHIAGQITQIDDTPSYELMAPRSFGESFVHDVLTAGAEFGIDVIG